LTPLKYLLKIHH